MMYIYFVFCIFITSFHVSYVTASYSLCGDWQTFAYEKCIKILDTEKLVTFEDGVKSCTQMDNSSEMLTIHSKEEQDFVSEYLFKTNKLVNNVWIGLRNKSKTFEWIDSSNKQYTNWRTGNPTNKPDFNCAELELDTSEWTNKPCLKKNLVVCQKLPEITIPELLKRLKKAEDDVKEMKAELDKKTENVSKVSQNAFDQISNVVFNKNVRHYELFTEPNGKKKAFLIPWGLLSTGYTIDDAVNRCKYLNSTLIEIESKEKQNLLESFLGQSGIDFDYFRGFWINGQREWSSGKWKWLKSGKEFTFTNWYTSNLNDWTYIIFSTRDNKWVNCPNTLYNTWQYICEYTFEF